MMHKSVIKMYIRQVLLEGEDSAGTVSKVSNSPDAGDYKRLESTSDADVYKKSLAGKRLSLSNEGEPAVTVLADNGKDIVVGLYINYINDVAKGFDTEYNENEDDVYTDADGEKINKRYLRVVAASDEFLSKVKDAEQIYVNSAETEQILARDPDWSIDDMMYITFNAAASDAKSFRRDELYGFFALPRETKSLKKPALIATRKARVLSRNFKCVLPMEDVFKITLSWLPGLETVPVTDKKWAAAAACWYANANDISATLTTGFVGAAAGALVGVFGGPFAPATVAGGAWLGMGLATTAHDIVNRIPVVIWAFNNEEYTFGTTNLVWMLILILFESLIHIKEFKAGFLAASTTTKAGAEAGVVESELLKRVFESRLVQSKIFGPNSITEDILVTANKLMDTGDAQSVAMKKAIQAGDTWTPIKITLVEFVVGLAVFLFGESVSAQSRKAAMDALDNPDMITSALLRSDARFAEYIEKTYPDEILGY